MAVRAIGPVDVEKKVVQEFFEVASKFFDTFELDEVEPTICLIGRNTTKWGEVYHVARFEKGHTVPIRTMIAELKRKTKKRGAR